MSRRRRAPPGAASRWEAPLALAALSAVGLVSGLLGDGLWDAVSWLALGAPVAVCLWFGFRPPRR